eukprot:312052-Prorocentrum_minimum.AAC.1
MHSGGGAPNAGTEALDAGDMDGDARSLTSSLGEDGAAADVHPDEMDLYLEEEPEVNEDQERLREVLGRDSDSEDDRTSVTSAHDAIGEASGIQGSRHARAQQPGDEPEELDLHLVARQNCTGINGRVLAYADRPELAYDMYCAVILYCTVRCCVALSCAALSLYCTVPYRTVDHCICALRDALCLTSVIQSWGPKASPLIIRCTVPYCTVLYCTARGWAWGTPPAERWASASRLLRAMGAALDQLRGAAQEQLEAARKVRGKVSVKCRRPGTRLKVRNTRGVLKVCCTVHGGESGVHERGDKAEAAAEAFKQARVVGTTVAGAARRLEALRAAQPFAVVRGPLAPSRLTET